MSEKGKPQDSMSALELVKNPRQVIAQMTVTEHPLAIVDSEEKPLFYCIPASIFEPMVNLLAKIAYKPH